VADGDRQFLLSVFLMEAWDTLAAVEDGLTALGHAPGEAATLENLAVVTHRLRGSAALSGFPQVSALATAMEETVERVAAAPAHDRRALAALSDMVLALKMALDAIGATGAEDGEAIAEALDRIVPAAPPEPGTETSRRLKELDQFFAGQSDVLEYFVPEAVEHLESMAQSLVVLEGDGATADEIASLFRAVHTLKGAAYTVGCEMIGALAHRIEDMLGEIRENRRALDRVAIETIFAGLDALRLLVRSGEGDSVPEGRAVAYERAMAMLATPPTLESPATGEPSEAVTAPEPAMAAALELRETVAAEAAPSREPIAAVRASTPSRPARELVARRARPSIRVSLDRLDALMNLAGELVVTRSRLDRHLAQLEQTGELLSFTQSRMTQTVTDFESKYAHRPLPDAEPSPPSRDSISDVTLGEVFEELEFDRYDDFNLLARRVGEISSDLTEIQNQLSGLVRVVREDAGGVQRLSGELRGQITRARMVPVGRLFAPFVRMVREAARAAGKNVSLEIRGETVEMDTTIVELMADPLVHLVRNAIAHGIESEEARRQLGKPPQGTLHLGAAHKGGSIYIEVADDGCGIDLEAVSEAARRGGFLTAETIARLGERDIVDLIFLPGLTTATSVTTAAGRGVGMDVVRTNVGRLGGEIEVQTQAGRGTRFRIRLPLTVAISDALMVRVGAETFAVPVPAVKAAMQIRPEDVRSFDGAESIEIDSEPVDLVRLGRLLRIPSDADGGSLSIVTLRTGRKTLAMAVDEFLLKEEIVIKSLGGFLQGMGPFSGATVTGEGQVILMLDALKLLEMSLVAPALQALEAEQPPIPSAPPAAEGQRRVLLVDDSVSVRKFVGGMLERAGFHVVAARDGAEALQQLAESPVDIVVTDLEMPRLNGYELIRDLSRESSTCGLPVVVLTTRAGAKHVNLARELGVEHYVAKPVDEASFVQLIESLATAAPVRGEA
jgi:chemosensory pili system protein ChpA (sensor histidine kinase/response regulator)